MEYALQIYVLLLTQIQCERAWIVLTCEDITQERDESMVVHQKV